MAYVARNLCIASGHSGRGQLLIFRELMGFTNSDGLSEPTQRCFMLNHVVQF
jgi:hypothetical protein